VGILGGIGPESTGEFYLRLITGMQEKGLITDNTDYPHIIVNSIPGPEPGEGGLELAEFIRGIRLLEKAGADFIVMACNTIHVYREELQEHVQIPIIDLREEVRKELVNSKRPVTVLATQLATSSGLFRFDGIEYNEVWYPEHAALERCIFSFNRGEDKDLHAGVVRSIARKYVGTAILAGCTEVSIMLKGSGIEYLDTMDILVEAAIREALP
jgi:aspartate racemase